MNVYVDMPLVVEQTPATPPTVLNRKSSNLLALILYEGLQDTMADRPIVLAHKLHHVTVVLQQGRDNGDHEHVRTFIHSSQDIIATRNHTPLFINFNLMESL